MKSQFYTDGKGNHRVTLEPENAIEKTMIDAMSLYECAVDASKTLTAAGEADALIITFCEPQRRTYDKQK